MYIQVLKPLHMMNKTYFYSLSNAIKLMELV